MRRARLPAAPRADHLAEHAPREERDVRGVLGEAAHEVRVPLRAEGDVDAHAVALAHELLLEVAAHAVEHLELVAVRGDALLLREALRLVDEALVVRGEAGVVPAL